jgi:hypothetical protein
MLAEHPERNLNCLLPFCYQIPRYGPGWTRTSGTNEAKFSKQFRIGWYTVKRGETRKTGL